MLEGKEFEKQLGQYGSVSVDVTPQLEVQVSLTAKLDIVAELQKIADKTKTPLDNTLLSGIKAFLALAAPKVEAPAAE